MTKFIFIFTVVMSFFIGQAEAGSKRLAVVELFTSQGCSSCPPADAFLGELAMRSDVLALSYHVDYWDYIGWNDVFAKPEFTNRQRDYAKTFNLRYVYTPQMVVSGEVENSGNQRRTIIKAIEDNLAHPIELSLKQDANRIILEGDLNNKEANVYRASFHKEIKTDVRRGENRGKTLTNYHIVDQLMLLGSWQGDQTQFEVPRDDLNPDLDHAVFVQLTTNQHILGAFRLN